MLRSVLIRTGLLAALAAAGCAARPGAIAATHDQAAHDHRQHPHGHFTDVAADVAQSGTAAVSFRSQVVPVLLKHCAGCHTEGGEGAAALTMFSGRGEPQYPVIRGALGRMLLEIQAGRMPKGRPNALSAEEFKVLDTWGASEMPDN